MRVLCVDNDERAMKHTLALCGEHPAVDCANGFTDARSALEWTETNRVELALLDIGLPDMNGIELAAELRKSVAPLAIVFLAKDAAHALEAYRARPQNYLLKPLDRKTLNEEISFYLLHRPARELSHIEVQTFGNFEITVDGSAVAFKRARAKELLALLVDKQGAGVPREQAFVDMWEDREYDRKAQKYFDVILRSLRQTLRQYGISEIMEVKAGYMRIRPELLSCDRYRFTMGDSDAINAYQGIYMYGYSWASWNGGFLD